jgi:hypothetical protein
LPNISSLCTLHTALSQPFLAALPRFFVSRSPPSHSVLASPCQTSRLVSNSVLFLRTYNSTSSSSVCSPIRLLPTADQFILLPRHTASHTASPLALSANPTSPAIFPPTPFRREKLLRVLRMLPIDLPVRPYETAPLVRFLRLQAIACTRPLAHITHPRLYAGASPNLHPIHTRPILSRLCLNSTTSAYSHV